MARMVSWLDPPQACTVPSVAEPLRSCDTPPQMRPAPFRLLGGEGGTTGVGADAAPRLASPAPPAVVPSTCPVADTVGE